MPRLKAQIPKHLNRAERRQVVQMSREMLEAIADEAALHVYATMTDPAVPPDLRLRAAFDILDRTQGRPVNKVEQRVLESAEDQVEGSLKDVPTEQLEAALATVRGLLTSGTPTNSSGTPEIEDAEVLSDSSGDQEFDFG